ncbi:LuxR C-terminal-related transcriptional regulator [Cupriavidus consociatus]|uniref:LuxR C-terminal-related transcriptional regulator n=1 Tax=Cupriavidus consociatus TaxID=2821357 RepID=UPI001AEAAF59|nr:MULTISPECIES: LuxR C-terminal-related transcriptional regulator [unclassified Cupriavidus]MBP0621671.1 LuxR family transcriptional regulator [Cupriavidus sp. LEh25]MDK2658346.1 LuxR C-terminal-related transcriptional regulator [Cupriavidus sp. LEh21]
MASIEETGRRMPSATGAGTAALAAKLRPPLLTPFQIERASICDAVCAADFVKLVLVRAPAGFGKTTAMLQCRARLEAAGGRTAWLTLDRSDNDATRFLGSVEAAIAQALGAAAQPPRSGLVQDPGEQALALIDRLASHSGAFTLFLDDFESIQNAAVSGLVWQMVESLPPGCRVVIGTRWVPESGLGRLRARGELLEIEPAQLRFSASETESFLRHARGLKLQPAAISALHRRTEGWATALWLASVAMERRSQPEGFIAGFSGSNAAIADYLVEDVFLHLPDAVRDFLLRTSILDQLCGPLCDAVCQATPAFAGGAGSSDEILAWLERANLFLLPLESERYGERGTGAAAEQWYRYHSLFSGFLRGQLAQSMPEAVPPLHLAASRWYESQGRPVPAIEHALAAGALGHALELLDSAVDDLLGQGRMRLLTRWLEAVPAEELARWPKLQIAHAWAVSFTRGPAEAIALLQAIPTEGAAGDLLAHIRALRHVLLNMMDRFDDARAFARNEVPPLPMGYAFPDAILGTSMARLAAVIGDYPEARRLLQIARQAVRGSDSNFNKIFSESVEGLIDLRQGRLQQALARFRIAARTMLPNRFGPTNGNAMAGILLAEGLYESGDTERASRLLNVYLPLSRDLGLPDQIITGHTVLARIAFERGETDQAHEWLAQLEALGHHRGLTRLVMAAMLERARLALRQGNVHAAQEAIERAADPALWRTRPGVSSFASDVEDIFVGRLRLDVHARPGAQVRDAIERELAAATSNQLMRRALKLRILLAQACQRSGDGAHALVVMGEALRFGAAEGFVRIFADEGDDVRRLVADACARQGASLPSAYVEKLLQACAQQAGAAPGGAAGRPAPPALVEPLTPKEQKVLQLLAEGFSNVAMAERLFVSETTVRTHLRNISAKLHASNRTQAVAIARQLGLL